MKAFYFSAKDRKLRYEDNRQIRVGRTHKVTGKIELCKNGLHASRRLIDALRYAPGPILYEVELGGTIAEGYDKAAASERTYLRSFDATEVLREFARKQALITIELIKPYCSKEEYDLIVRYLETGDESVQEAAIEAARAATGAAAWAAADAARAAARAAAKAAWAAEAAADAARAAARASGNYDKHMDEANEMLTEMIREATGWNN